jgi:hypothetical protein
VTAAITLYDTVVALHVVATVSAFGVLLAWPWLPAGSAGAHRARSRLLGVVVTRSAGVGLLLGAYLATDRGLWSEPWVSAPLAIMVVLLGVVGGYLTPAERRLAELCDDGDESAVSAAARPVKLAALACFGLAATAAFLMVTKPGL